MNKAWVLIAEDGQILFLNTDKKLAKQVKKDIKPMVSKLEQIEYRIL